MAGTAWKLFRIIKRGGVVAGSSAGARILASYLVRGDPKGAEVNMAGGGFGFIWNSAIDQHVSERHRERDMEAVIAAHPKLPGIGIDPNTVIVVHEDQFEVPGSGKVTITQTGQQQYSLSSGGHFDLRRRKPL
jgi:cyanophycinase